MRYYDEDLPMKEKIKKKKKDYSNNQYKKNKIDKKNSHIYKEKIIEELNNYNKEIDNTFNKMNLQ